MSPSFEGLAGCTTAVGTQVVKAQKTEESNDWSAVLPLGPCGYPVSLIGRGEAAPDHRRMQTGNGGSHRARFAASPMKYMEFGTLIVTLDASQTVNRPMEQPENLEGDLSTNQWSFMGPLNDTSLRASKRPEARGKLQRDFFPGREAAWPAGS
ncbi:uncharacterized protein N7482_000105 [Penicillium canariense]|uniref:Uncharacterized protein n=1 Tax=Penicillium canariense TaxID=189055 RepID=A0A9W9LRP9_9EURO|nr:uncharacterized protein N7482_000105 [Penicillium canariense]KAJ5174228.1 hypothetical protein N7482_000105 [Penicillium canariense]